MPALATIGTHLLNEKSYLAYWRTEYPGILFSNDIFPAIFILRHVMTRDHGAVLQTVPPRKTATGGTRPLEGKKSR